MTNEVVCRATSDLELSDRQQLAVLTDLTKRGGVRSRAEYMPRNRAAGDSAATVSAYNSIWNHSSDIPTGRHWFVIDSDPAERAYVIQWQRTSTLLVVTLITDPR